MSSPAPARRSSRPVWLMLAGVVIAWAGLFAWGRYAAPVDLVPWRTDVEAALADAKREAQPVLLNFTADWCPPCQQMKADVYSDPEFAAWLPQRFVPVKVDLTSPGPREEAFAIEHRVEVIPTIIVLASDGTVLARTSGAAPRDALRDGLTRLLDTHAAARADAPPVETDASGS